MANTRETMGEQECLDALVADTLTAFEDDGVTRVSSYGLYYKKYLQNVRLDNCTSLGDYAFMGDTSLKVVDILGTGSITTGALSETALEHFVMRGLTKTGLSSGSSVFSSTRISANRGAIYVPESILSAYKADSQWNQFRIEPLSNYPLNDFSTISDSWSEIIAKAEAGTAADSYSIGDTKMIDLGTEGKIYMEIVGFGVDQLASNSSQYAGITFVAQDLLTTPHRMNVTNSSGSQGTGANGGWEYSEMRSYLAEDILPLLPQELSSGIKTVTKYSDYIVPKQSTITHDLATEDRLWIPSAREIASVNEQSGPYYSVYNNNASRNKRKQDYMNGTYWLRTAAAINAYRTVSSGSLNTSTAPTELYVALGFCV